MGEVNRCLQVIFILFNVSVIILLISTFGYYGIYMQSYFYKAAYFWFGIYFTAFACYGIYGGCSKKNDSLESFRNWMAFGIICLLIYGIYAAVNETIMSVVISFGSAGYALFGTVLSCLMKLSSF